MKSGTPASESLLFFYMGLIEKFRVMRLYKSPRYITIKGHSLRERSRCHLQHDTKAGTPASESLLFFVLLDNFGC